MSNNRQPISAIVNGGQVPEGSPLPEIGSRWIHKSCKRIIVVTGIIVYDGNIDGAEVSYHYERGPTTNTAYKTRHVATQAMKHNEWRALFTKRAEGRT